MTAKKTLRIRNKLGLHARAASVFVKAASAYQAQITIATADKSANGKSIMSVMALGAAPGTQVTLTATGADAKEALTTLTTLIKNHFNENE